MSTYLGRLKSVLAENAPPQPLTKLTEAPSPPAKVATPVTDRTDKRPSVSFVSTSGTPFSERYDCEPRLAQVDDDAADVRDDHIAELSSKPCPDGFAPQRWAVLWNGVLRFAKEWAGKAMSLGWTFEELFALRDPFANVSLQGAAWFIADSTVTAVTADAITLRTASGATLRSYRKRA